MTKNGQNPITGAEAVTWDLSVLYNSIDDPAIDADMQKAEKMADDFAAAYKGKVAALDAATVAQAVQAAETIYDLLVRLWSYSSLVHSTDTADSKNGALRQKVTEFYSKVVQKIVFFELEWNNLEEDQAKRLLDDPALARYRHYLEAERRYKPYQLDEAREQLLIEKSVTGRQSWVRFFTQLTSAMRYQFEGEELNQSEILAKMHDPDRTIREKAADSVTIGLRERVMELTYIFNILAADKATDDRQHRKSHQRHCHRFG